MQFWQGITIGQIVTVVVIIGVPLALARLIWPALQKVVRLTDDWFGHEARDGVPERLSVPAQLLALTTAVTSLQTDMTGVVDRLDRVEHELSPNSGKSLRDAVDRVERQVSTSVPTND